MSPLDAPSSSPPSSITAFQSHLSQSTRIIAIIGAGLSVASGLPTFRDTSGLWHNHDVFMIASPNPAHHALAKLAAQKPGFVALSQNVDGLLQRAGMVAGGQLKLLHGDLFELVCAGGCGFVEGGRTEEPLCEVLSVEGFEGRRRNVLGSGVEEGAKPPKASALLFEGIMAKNRKILGERFAETGVTAGDAAPLRGLGEEERVRVPDTAPAPVLRSGIEKSELPQCPGCGEHLLRPGVVWFGESIPEEVMRDVDGLLENEEKIDLCLVIGTSSTVWPTAGFCEKARKRGARIAWVNTKAEDNKSRREGDWEFIGDAAVVLPEILGV